MNLKLEGHYIIGVPAYDSKLHTDTVGNFLSVVNTTRDAGARTSLLTVTGNSLVQLARNYLVHEFLKTPGTHLFMLDADIIFQPADMLRVMAWCNEFDVVAGCYPTKGDNPIFHVHIKDYNGATRVRYNSLIEVEKAPTGFMCVRRKVFEDIIGRYPERFLANDHVEKYRVFDTRYDKDAGLYVGEDYFFCERVLATGHEIYVDPTCRLQHVGEKKYEGCLADSLSVVGKVKQS